MTGAELAAIRKAHGLSQLVLSRRAEISRHAVSYWECKVHVDRRAWAVRAIAQVLPVPAEVSAFRARNVLPDGLKALREAEQAAFSAYVARRRAAEDVAKTKLRLRCGAKTRKGAFCRLLLISVET